MAQSVNSTLTKNLILASQSPRRRELLDRAGFRFTVLSVQISEIPDENLNLTEQIRQLAADKAEACLKSGMLPKQQGNLLLSADTLVVFGEQILGKPKDRIENAQFLVRLSGQKHRVITGICLLDVDSGRRVLSHEISTVLFKTLTPAQISSYVETDEGLDKAGGYGIQGPAGAFVENLEGSFENVMGLPVELIRQILIDNNWCIDGQ